VFSTTKRAAPFDNADTSIHLPVNLDNLGKKRVIGDEHLPETAQSTKKNPKVVGKRANNNLTQIISAKPVEAPETKIAKKKRGIKGMSKLEILSNSYLETSIVFESTASVQEKRVRKELEAPVKV
jgi:hypothetical protein